MWISLAQRLEQGARHLLPLVSTLIFVLVSVIAWPLPDIGPVAPSLGLVGVYYWSIHRPDLFRTLPVFLLGLLNDFINFYPYVGLSAMIFIAVHELLIRQRRFFVGHAFYMLWSGFALVMLVVLVSIWLIMSLLNGQWMAFMPVLLQGLLTTVIFPLLAWLLIRLQRLVLAQG